MEFLLLTQYSGKILGPIAKWILGPILNGIFIFLNWLHIPNVGVAIILFTIVIYLLLLPLTIKQQKFSKLQAKMQPEITAIQNKYKGRKDQDSQMAMNQETQAVYAKYGVSPTGSCVQLLIQMPILLALYRVIYAIPAYVPMIKNAYTDLVSKLMGKEGSIELIKGFKDAAMFKKQFDIIDAANATPEVISNTFIDSLNRATSADWLSVVDKYPDLSQSVESTMGVLSKFNNFLGLNIGYSPSNTINNALASKNYLLIVGAILIPILAAVTQWINVKLTPTANSGKTGNDQADSMAASMKTMNTIMPIFSAVMCFTLPAGLGLYWVAGSVVRSIQQVFINKYIDRMDLEAEIQKNVEKRNEKLRKAGIDPNKLTQNASLSTKSIVTNNNRPSIASKANLNGKPVDSEEAMKSSTEYYNKNAAKPGSLAAKANMVKQYNERNNKKGE